MDNVPNHGSEEHKQQQMLVRMWEKGALIHCWWGYKLVQRLWKTVWRLLKKLKLELPWKYSNTAHGHISEGV
jgi:hypothetical protein